ncbi:MAG: hypothetical protein ACRC1K_17605 [Planctomycetia bacterium]
MTWDQFVKWTFVVLGGPYGLIFFVIIVVVLVIIVRGPNSSRR